MAKQTKSSTPKRAAKSKQIPIALELENLAFLKQIQKSIGHNRWTFTATVNYALEQLRLGKKVEGV